MLCLLVPAGLVAAQSAAIKRFDLPADLAERSLKRLSQQSGVEVLFATEMTTAVRTAAVKGEFSVLEAANRALAHTGLVAVQDRKSGAVIINRSTPPQETEAAPQERPGDPNHSSSAKKKAPAAPSNEPMKSNLLTRLTASLAWLATPLVAQVAPAASSMPETEEVVELSPFVVSTTQDTGYQATNTLSGTRLNSSLRDTPASVSVMTQEFLQDVGLDTLGELVNYSVNSEVDEFDTLQGDHPDQINAKYPVRPISTRGIRASQGLDFFVSITPDDSYRTKRYDDSRGPNGILFGVSEAGGLINQSSKVANTRQDSAKIKWSTGSYDRNRTEFEMNKILRQKSLAVSLAGLHQENGGWRLYDFNDKQRIFGAVLIRPHKNVSINAMAEKGHDIAAIVPAYTPVDNALAWIDNRDARGVAAVTFAPLNANPTAAMQALGVTTRNAAANGINRRLAYIVNDGTLFDSVGTYFTGSYNNRAVRAPDGTPGGGGDVIRINDPSLVPYHVNANGPGHFRDLHVKNYTATADWQIAKGLYANLAHNFQETELTAHFMPGAANPSFRGDPNTTLGVRGAQNPYVGQLYFEGNWRRGYHLMERRENRLSLSYDLKTRRFGSHRMAGMASRVDERDIYANGWLVLAGSPFAAAADAANNRVSTRQYIDPRDPRTFHGGDWRDVPSQLAIDGNSYDVVWANTSAQTTAAGQRISTGLVVAQSHFFDGRLVTTLGYREDSATATTFGQTLDPIAGAMPDFDPAKSIQNKYRGTMRTQGLVYHVGRHVSLIANASSNIGIPDFSREVFPHGSIAEPSRGKGRDIGISVDLWDRKLTAKAVYYETSDEGKVFLYNSVNLFQNPNIRIMDAFETVLVGPGRPISGNEWAALYEKLTPTVRGSTADTESRGYEFSAIANPMPNLRLVMNYSYSNRTASNLYRKEVLPWYGFTMDGGLVKNGVTQDATGSYILDPGAYEAGGTIAQWLELSQRHPDAALSTLMTSGDQTIAEEIFITTEGMNERIRAEEKRWGLRPHRVSLFAAYDFKKENFLKGVTVGGGYRWRSANIIGADENGREITGRPIREADFMLRYARSVKPKLWKGRLVLQVNVINVFNDRGITPRYLSASPPFEVPGGRGVAYNRFDIIAPRMVRFTTTYEF